MSDKCRDIEAHVFHYLDGEMGRFRRWRLRRHLRDCPPCGNGIAFEGKLLRKIRDGCVDEVPEELWNRIRAFIRHNGATDMPGDPAGGGPDV